MSHAEENSREHLFISYAGEDWALAEWLTRKLTAEGYAVWCDRFQLLGGESYPKDIDIAIKTRTFRLLALLSQHSIDKPNPRKERTLALNLSREWDKEFLIPINVDGLSPTELDWMTNDLTFIPFEPSWARGLGQLLKKLQRISTPRPLTDGRSIAANTVLPESFLRDEPEILRSNEFPILELPGFLFRYRLGRKPSQTELESLRQQWAFYKKSNSEFLAFVKPPASVADGQTLNLVEEIAWRDRPTIDNIATSSIIANLVVESIKIECLRRGLHRIPDGRNIYFPKGLLEKNKLSFTNYTGARIRILAVGQRRRRVSEDRVETTQYHIAPVFRWIGRPEGESAVQLHIEFYFTTEGNRPLPPAARPRARKRHTRMWTNHKWLSRVYAIAKFLADGKERIYIGDTEGQRLTISAEPRSYEIPFGIDESRLATSQDVSIDAEDDGSDDTG